MAAFKVTLKRVVYAEVTIEANSAAEIREMLKQGDADLDYFGMSNKLWGDEIKVASIKREAVPA